MIEGGGSSRKINLKLDFIFGLRRDLFPNLFMIDSDTILYPAANYLVLLNTSKKLAKGLPQQQFIKGKVHSKGIVTVNVFSGNKKYIAFGEETNVNGYITFYTVVQNNNTNLLHRNLEITLTDLSGLPVNRIHHLAFSQREKSGERISMYFGVICEKNDSKMLIIWKWDGEPKERILDYDININNNESLGFLHLSFSSEKNEKFCIISKKFVNFYEIENKNVKSGNSIKLENYGNTLSYCWIGLNLALCNENNILIFNDQKLIQIIPIMSNTFNVIYPLLDSFILGGNNGVLEVYEEKKTHYFEKKSNMIKIEIEKEKTFDFQSIVGITHPNDLIIYATTNKNDLIQINLKEHNDLDRITYQNFVKYLISPFHSDSVEGLDTCICKPYIITCSKDKTIKLWDIQNKNIVINKQFDEEMYSIAYHPSGMHAVVSCNQDKIKPLNIFYDEINTMIPNGIVGKKSKDIRFSNGGQYFAFDSSNKIEVWDFNNMQLYNGLKYTTHANKINSITWAPDDERFLIAGQEILYEWKLKDISPSNIFSKKTMFLSASYINNNSQIILSSEDNFMRKINTKDGLVVSDFEFPGGLKDSTICTFKEIIMLRKSKVLICLTHTDSSSTSCIRVFNDISTSSRKEWENFYDEPTHHRESFRIRVNYDENQLYTCGSDGSILVFNIDSYIEGEELEKLNEKQLERYTNVVLLKKGKLKEKESEKIKQPKDNEEILKKLKQDHEDKMNEKNREHDLLTTELIKKKQSGTKNIDNKEGEYKNLDNDFKHKLEILISEKNREYEEKKSKNLEVLNGLHNKIEENRRKLKDAKAKVKEEKEKSKNEFNKQMEDLKAKYENDIASLRQQKESKEIEIRLKNVEKDKETKAVEWVNDEIKKEMEDKIKELKKGIEDLNAHYKNQNKKLIEKKEQQNNQIVTLEADCRHLEAEKVALDNKIINNMNIEKDHQAELKQIQASISNVESGIIECKKKYQYLDKCKFVLDYKIKELKKEIGPIEKMIDELKKQTKALDRKLKKFNREHDLINSQLVEFKDLKAKITELSHEERKEKNDISKFKNELFNMLNDIDNKDKLYEGVRNLTSHLEGYKEEKKNDDLTSEFKNQKEGIINEVNERKQKLMEKQFQHKEEIKFSRDQNKLLIERIGKLKEKIGFHYERKKKKAADDRHRNAIADIKAKRVMKKKENEYQSLTHEQRIEEWKNLLERKKLELEEVIKSTDNVDIHNSAGSDNDDNSQIKEDIHNESNEK